MTNDLQIAVAKAMGWKLFHDGVAERFWNPKQGERIQDAYLSHNGADSDFDTVEQRAELRIKIGQELADLVIYADLLARRLDLDLSRCIVDKFNEVSDRRGSSIKL